MKTPHIKIYRMQLKQCLDKKLLYEIFLSVKSQLQQNKSRTSRKENDKEQNLIKLKIKKQKKSIKPKIGSLTTAKPLAKQPKCKRHKAQITHLSRYTDIITDISGIKSKESNTMSDSKHTHLTIYMK